LSHFRTYLFLSGLLILVAASYWTRPRRVPGADKPILAGANIPPKVYALIDSACRDCHSDATRYPWYSYIAPMTILIENDVKVGRERLNLSQWAEYSSVRRQRSLSMMANQVQDGEMPLKIYTWMHRDAVLSPADRELIFEWTQSERTRLITEAAAAAK
jgi:NADH:ubiquinone oxidoreductase subunit